MLKVGDIVCHCVRWVPGEISETLTGRGIISMITEDSFTGAKKARLRWEDGQIIWLPIDELVREDRVFSSGEK